MRPDIVLLDIEMPGMNGISVTKYITHFFPKTKVIILSSHEDKKYLVQALSGWSKSIHIKRQPNERFKTGYFWLLIMDTFK